MSGFLQFPCRSSITSSLTDNTINTELQLAVPVGRGVSSYRTYHEEQENHPKLLVPPLRINPIKLFAFVHFV